MKCLVLDEFVSDSPRNDRTRFHDVRRAYGQKMYRNFHILRRVPSYRPARITLGVALVIGGLAGFLPVLGFWMIPLGVVVLSVDFPVVRRGRRRFAVWFGRTFQNKRR